MMFTFFAFGVAIAFFISSLILLNYGRRLGLKYLQRDGADGMAGLPAVEGAVFALIGLLVAFTVSGALHRYDERRQLVLQEANAATTAYDRLGLFEDPVARDLRTNLREYVAARIELYRIPHDFSLLEGSEIWSSEQQQKIAKLKVGLSDGMLATCLPVNFRPACALSAPALSSLFDVARLRVGAAEKHPPNIIFIMLFGLGLGASLLAGFGMAAAKARSWIHMVTFAATLAVTLYVVTELEFPRLGFINIESFDRFLDEAYEQMK
jgi:hypothetical protein